MTTLEQLVDNRNNNFNLLRFVASIAVLYCHCYPTTGIINELTEFGGSIGFIAVDIFFITSGFLVTASLLTRADVIFFIWSRFLRIFPGLFVNLIFCVFILGPLFTKLSIQVYFSDFQLVRFLFKNLSLTLEPRLPGVFESNYFKDCINISLWTLPWEFKMYCLLAGIGLLGYLNNLIVFQKIAKKLIISILIVGVFMYISKNITSDNFHTIEPFRFTTMFFFGATLFVGRKLIVLSNNIFMLSILLLISYFFIFIVFPFVAKWFLLLYIVSLSYIVIYFAYRPKGILLKFNNLPDWSYGIYIYGFPIQQSLAAIYHNISIPTMFISSMAASLLIANLSWYFVEKRALTLKKHIYAHKFLRLKIITLINSK